MSVCELVCLFSFSFPGVVCVTIRRVRPKLTLLPLRLWLHLPDFLRRQKSTGNALYSVKNAARGRQWQVTLLSLSGGARGTKKHLPPRSSQQTWWQNRGALSGLNGQPSLHQRRLVKCLLSKPSRIGPVEGAGRQIPVRRLRGHTRQPNGGHVRHGQISCHCTASCGRATYLDCVYEQELRDECGYRGYRPCWNWGKYALISSQFAICDAVKMCW